MFKAEARAKAHLKLQDRVQDRLQDPDLLLRGSLPERIRSFRIQAPVVRANGIRLVLNKFQRWRHKAGVELDPGIVSMWQARTLESSILDFSIQTQNKLLTR